MVYDAKDVKRENIDVNHFGQFVPVLSDYFPETLFRMYIVNANIFIKSIWKVASVFVSDVTLEKTKLAGEDPTEIVECLGLDMDVDEIPVHFGGKNSRVDENGPVLSTE